MPPQCDRRAFTPRAAWPAGAVHLDDSAHTASPRPDHRPTAQAPHKLLPPLRRRPTQQVLAVRFHPLVAGRRHRRRDPVLARRPLPLPAGLHRLRRVGGGDVEASFTDTAATHGLPAATLTDNGSVYTSRFTHGHNDFERLLASLGVTQKNGHPGHPQTQGKIERFHSILKQWLRPRQRPSTLAELQTQLDTFAPIYNTQRLHRSLPRRATPQSAYRAPPKAVPSGAAQHFRIRHGTVDQFGKLTLRHGSRLHHLGIGRRHARTDPRDHPNRHRHQQNRPQPHRQPHHRPRPQLLANYWRNQQKNPGRWPERSVTDDATHHNCGARGLEPLTPTLPGAGRCSELGR